MLAHDTIIKFGGTVVWIPDYVYILPYRTALGVNCNDYKRGKLDARETQSAHAQFSSMHYWLRGVPARVACRITYACNSIMETN